MKIKEVELRTSITSKNIRFYEKKGLLTPNRDINRYREFNEDDVKRLKEIKFLRNLGISLEDLLGLFRNEIELYELLDNRIKYLDKQISNIINVKKVCCQMRSDNYIHDKISQLIYDFEDIIMVSPNIVKERLKNYKKEKLVIALLGSSPKVNQYFMSLFPDIDYAEEKKKIGIISIDAIEKIHNEIIKVINSEI